jgi:hypothetical protein
MPSYARRARRCRLEMMLRFAMTHHHAVSVFNTPCCLLRGSVTLHSMKCRSQPSLAVSLKRRWPSKRKIDRAGENQHEWMICWILSWCSRIHRDQTKIDCRYRHTYTDRLNDWVSADWHGQSTRVRFVDWSVFLSFSGWLGAISRPSFCGQIKSVLPSLLSF